MRPLAVLLCSAIPALFASAAQASPLSFQGYSGLLETPDALVTAEGSLDFGVNNDLESESLRRVDRSQNYLFSVGIWDRLELGGRLAGSRFDAGSDLSGNVKLNLFRNDWLALAAGAGDFAGESNLLRSRYGVATVSWQTVQLSGGYGVGPDRLDGAFGGMRWAALPFVDVVADYDAQEFNGGVRLHHRFANGATLYALAAASTFKEQKHSFAIGLSLPLSKGLQREAPATTVSRTVPAAPLPAAPPPVRAIVTTDTPRNSLIAIEAVAERAADRGHPLIEYRYGIPLRELQPRSTASGLHSSAARWVSWNDDKPMPPWTTPMRGEVRISPDLRSFVGTEVGIFDYSLAVDTAARVQLPLGLAAYAEYESAAAHSRDFDDGRVFGYRRHESGLREAAAQWAVHPLAGLVGLATAGRTMIDNLDYDFMHGDLAWMPGSGRHRLRVAYGDYQARDALNFPDHRTKLVEYRYWWIDKGLAASLAYGDFFADDRGTRLELQRYFGDVILTTFYKRSSDGAEFGGFGISLPLTVKRPPKLGPVVLTGAPRWGHAVGTTIDSGLGYNPLDPFFLIEPLPRYSLVRDVLDSDRAFPAYAHRYGSEGP